VLIDHPTIEDLTMNKSELIESLAAKKSLTFKKAEEVVNAVFASMTDALLYSGPHFQDNSLRWCLR
jgi:hypothetical protein